MPQSGNTITSESISATQLALKAVITSRIDDLAVTTAKINTEAVTQAKITANSIDGTIAANVADVNIIGGIPVVHRVLASALSGDVDVVLTHKTRIIDVICVATAAGAAADTITVKNSASAITNAIDLNVVDTTVVRAGTIDNAQWDISAAGTLRVTGASAVNAEVIIYGIRVA